MGCSAQCVQKWVPLFLGIFSSLYFGYCVSAPINLLNPVFAQLGTTPEEVWAKTPAQVKVAILDTGVSGLAFTTTILYLSLRGHHQGLCSGLAIGMLCWQPYWYKVGMRVGNIPASKIFLSNTIAEMSLACIFGYVAFAAPTDGLRRKVRGSTRTAKVRLILLCVVPAILGFLHIFTAFCNPQDYVTLDTGMQDPTWQDATKGWESTPSQAKEAAMERLGWVLCVCSLMFCTLICEPGADRDLCIGWAIILITDGVCMLYAASGGDYQQMRWQRPFIYDWVPGMAIFGFLGFIGWGKEEDSQAASEMLLQGVAE